MSCTTVGIAFLFGAVLCLRFNVLTLCFAMAALTVWLWVSNLAHQISFGETFVINVSLIAALQLGYLFSIVLQAVVISVYEKRSKRIFDGRGTGAHKFSRGR
jgi:hypothetical protein